MAFFGLSKYTKDLPEVAAMGLGVVGAQMAWGYVSPYIPSAVKNLHPAVTPALELAAGVAVFATLGSRGNKWVKWGSLGAAAGLAAGGAMGVLGAFGVLNALPSAAGASAAGATGGYLGSAPIDVTEVAGFAGAPVDISEVSGLGTPIAATFY